ncbi:MAG: 50S ribosomal protein L3 [Nitrospirales bacterium]|nr:50S ribosomal protein L3 [Nitrospirales bacterium]
MLGKKLGMIQVYDSHRRLIPVTVIEAGPCGVAQVKTRDRDGYDAVQVGFEEIAEKKISKPLAGHFRSKGSRFWRYLREFSSEGSCKVGDMLTVEMFSLGDGVVVRGVSKGKGFQGVIKRHNYAGGPASHGSMFHRAPGSIGNSSFPSRVWKNKALPGQMGNKNITIQGLKVIEVRPEENLLFVSGSVPGSIGSLLEITKSKKDA